MNSMKIPEDMTLVRTEDLISLLEVAIARGERLGYIYADEDYEKWLGEIKASQTKHGQ